MSPQLENEKRPITTAAAAMQEISAIKGECNYVAFREDYILVDGMFQPEALRRIADLWDACHDEEGNER